MYVFGTFLGTVYIPYVVEMNCGRFFTFFGEICYDRLTLFELCVVFGVFVIVFAIVMILLTRMVSVGSVLVAILYPILAFFVGTEFYNKWVYLALALILAASVLIRHKANIKRILSGTENKLWKTKEEKCLQMMIK